MLRQSRRNGYLLACLVLEGQVADLLVSNKVNLEREFKASASESLDSAGSIVCLLLTS